MTMTKAELDWMEFRDVVQRMSRTYSWAVHQGLRVKANDLREDYVRSKLTRAADGGLTVEPHPVQDSSMLSVLAWSSALLVRPPHDPARKAGDTVQVIDLSVLAGGY